MPSSFHAGHDRSSTVLSSSYDPGGRDAGGWTTDRVANVTRTGDRRTATVGHHDHGSAETTRTLDVTYDALHPEVVIAAHADVAPSDGSESWGGLFVTVPSTLAAVAVGTWLVIGVRRAHKPSLNWPGGDSPWPRFMPKVPSEVTTAMTRCLDEVEQTLREQPCADVERADDLGWLFDDEVRGWPVSVLLAADVQRREGELRVPLMCQARKGRGLRGHDGDTLTRTVALDCECVPLPTAKIRQR